MKTGLSNREKKLVFIMLIFGTIALTVQFAILPMNNTLAAMRAELITLDSRKFEYEIRLSHESAIRQNHVSAMDAANEIVARYPGNMPNEEIDKILTNLCLDSGMIPMSLGIGGASALQIDSTSSDVFLGVTAYMDLRGDYDSLKTLIDNVNRLDYLRITQFSYSMGSPSVSPSFELSMLGE